MAKITQTASKAGVSEIQEAGATLHAVGEASPSTAEQIDAVVRRRESRQQPVFHMDKSLINTPPPPLARELMEGKKESRKSAWEVGPAEGVAELRQEIAHWRRDLYAERITSENVLITPGASAAFFLSLSSLVDPGQKVIMMPPCFPSYMGAVGIRGAEVTKVPLLPGNDFEPSYAQLESSWCARTRLAVCTLPNNPTATTFDNSSVSAIERLACKRGGRVVIDETFAAFDLRPEGQALRNLSLATTVTLGSFSESFSIADLRVGYIIGPKETICEMAKMQGCISAGASARAQEIAFAALRERESHFSRLIPNLRRRDAELKDSLAKVPGIEAVVGYAGPFKWIKTAAADSARLAVDLVRETGITVRPGVDYGQEGWVRIAFGMIKSDTVYREALQRLHSYKGWQAEPSWDSDIKLPARPKVRSSGIQALP